MEGCKKSSYNHCLVVADCVNVLSFIENYSKSIQNSSTFFIKGVVLDDENKIGAYSREVKVIEDLKGNLPRKKSHIPVWHISASQNDTLIMLLNKCYLDDRKGYDYKTFLCGISVLTLSNGYVSGYITELGEDWETTSWDEFQKLVKSLKK